MFYFTNKRIAVILIVLLQLSTARGCIVGDLQFVDKVGTAVDCRQHPVLISSQFESIEQVESNARFVLIVEKDATFAKLCDEQLIELLGPCIMITVFY